MDKSYLEKQINELYEFAIQDNENVLKIVDIGEIDEYLAKK